MRLKIVVIGSLLLGATTFASAQKDKDKKKDCPEGAVLEDGRCEYRRQAEVKVKVKIDERTRPLVEKENAKDEGPTLSADEILEVEGAVGDIREDQIQLLEALIEETPDSEEDEKADLYFRLAEAHAQQHRYWRLKTQEWAIKADNTKKDSDKKKYKKESEDSAKKAKEGLLKAVDAYKKLAANDAFKDYSNMDKALFKFGYMLQNGRYMKEARSVYQRLIKEYPDSPYIPDAKVAFGDYYFEMAATEPDKFKEHLENAEEEYKAVLQFPKSNVYTYAMYKMGWVYVNLGKHTEAFEVFFKVADLTKGDEKKKSLNKAAKKDLVRAYAEMGKAEMAYKTFQRVDKKYAFDMLQILGDIYLDGGKGNKAIYTFRELMSLDKKHKNVCLWQYNIAHAMLTEGSNKEKVEEIENLVNLYGALRDAKTLPDSEAEECHDNAAAMSGDLARAYHNESIKTMNSETLEYADRLYHVYLKWFPDADDYGETQYYYAELLWSRAESEKNARKQTELWENAAVEFTNVVKNGKVEEKLMKEAAYAAVLGWKNALAVDPRVKAPTVDPNEKPGELPPPKEIPERELKMLDAFDVYIKYIKDAKDSDLVGMKFLKANIYRKYNHFDEATPIFIDILEHHKSHETALYSANLLLDTYNRQQNFDQMIVWVDKLLADEKWLEDKEELKEVLDGLKITSMRKAVEQIEKKAMETKDNALYVKCGEMYIDLFNRNPDADDAHEIIYNAGVCFELGKSIGTAIQMFELLSANYPKANQTKFAVARLGLDYGRIAWYKESATKFEEYAKKYGGMDEKAVAKAKEVGLPTAYQAMSTAVFYRKGIGDDEKAIADTATFIKMFAKGKNNKDGSDASFALTSIYEKQGDKDKTVAHLRKYIKEYGGAGADRVVVAYAKIGQILWEQSCKVKLVNGSCIKVTRERAVRSASKGKKKKKGVVAKLYCNAFDASPTVPGTPKVLTVNRDDELMKGATTAFKAAIKTFEAATKGGKAMAGDEAAARFWYAKSRFLLADQKFEEYLALKFPSNLDFNPNNETKLKKEIKRFETWFESKIKAGGAAREAYEPLFSKPVIDITHAIAATARLGQIQQNFTAALYAAEVPEEQRKDEELWYAYCDTLAEKAEPLEAKSIEAFSVCLNVSTDLGWFNEWSKLCEFELGQIQPNLFPTAAEIRADPDQLVDITVVEAPIYKLPE